ncbi:MAG: hypothetical protein HC827_00975 [Cyanobacteria bacterium RM1_2_2]|nr:hypothetical protein [Cyanobacteria bacterium RM1_2_2]
MTSSIDNRPIVLDYPEPPLTPASEELRIDLTQAISPDALESNADRLMNAVFADVDRMLERGVSLLAEPADEVAVEESTPEPIVPLESILPPKLSPRDLIPQTAELSVELAESAAEQSALETVTKSVEPTEVKKAKHSLWFAVLCSSMLVSAAILSYLFRDQLTQVWLSVLSKYGAEPTVTNASPTTEAASEQDTDFLTYVQRSLERLSNRSDAEPEIASQPSPTILISPAASPTVVERVYVPVYPSPQPSPTANSPVAPNQPSASSNPSNGQARPAPSLTTPSLATAPIAVPNIAVTTHTLIGVLALGERSAALFEIDGTPQRIEIGGQIGSSGWALVSIDNQAAIVRKNGEVRSIYVGQKF